MQLLAPAKINFSLKILGPRSDGFHEIETLIMPITLYDEIEIRRSDSNEIEFHCDDPSVPAGEDNLIIRAAKSFFTATKLKSAISIDLKKKIPHGAGLGGGSSDAASTRNCRVKPWRKSRRQSDPMFRFSFLDRLRFVRDAANWLRL